MDNGHCIDDLPIKMLIFHSYVSLPTGIFYGFYVCLFLFTGIVCIQHHPLFSHTDRSQNG